MLVKFWQNRKFRRDLVIVVSIGTILAIISPFGATEGLPFWGAWIYWIGLLTWGWCVASMVGPMLRKPLASVSEFFFYFLVSIVMAFMVLPIILLVQWLIQQPIPVSYWVNMLFFVWVISVAITGIAWLSEKAFSKSEIADGSTFLARIPARLSSGDLLAVSSEDHYLRIHTSLGSDLILMRLADAVRELKGYDGMQVHRSWWVARQGVENVSREQSKILLQLRDGTEVPVSRTFAAKVRDKGWLG